MRHSLKTWPVYYEAIRRGDKTYELRKNDRGFAVGDILELNEWDPASKEPTGRCLFRLVSYMMENFPGIETGYCVLAIKEESIEPWEVNL